MSTSHTHFSSVLSCIGPLDCAHTLAVATMRTALSLLLVPPPKSRVVSRAVLARRTFPYLFKRGAYAASPVIAAASDKRMSEGESASSRESGRSATYS